MSAYIQNIATQVPEVSYDQDFLRDRMKKYFRDQEATPHIIHRIYSKSGIEKRHTVINDFNANGSERFFFKKDGAFRSPSTGRRNRLYTEHAKTLYADTARQTIVKNRSVEKQDITHVITVSCTGFFAPDPGYEIIKQLGLSPQIQRFHIGFMGCFAAFQAMKMAKAFCECQPEATVLVVCLELCSIHLQASEDTDSLISASVFADGAAGMIIQSQPSEHSSSIDLRQFCSSIVEGTESDMAWTIGDTGFEMALSTYVPQIIDSNLATAIRPLIEDYNLTPEQIQYWAVHPGGRAILDKVEENLKLDKKQIASSRKILASYGNMSSATILFVLADLLRQPQNKDCEPILAMAFGPGLTIESGLMYKIQL